MGFGNSACASWQSRHVVALIVLNHNRKQMLLECLRHAEASSYEALHIVMVDNGSTDGSVEAVESFHPKVRVVRNTVNVGVAGGRNTGIRWVKEHLNVRYVVFIDNDTLLDRDAIAQLVAAVRDDDRIGLAAPKAYRSKENKMLVSAGGMHFNPYTGVVRDVASGRMDRGQYNRSKEIQACPGFAFLVRCEVFPRVGYFDETFNPYGWEDIDFSLRARRAGFRIAYAPAAIIYHTGGRAGRGVVSLYEHHKARNMLYFIKRHTTMLQWIVFLCVLPIRTLVRITREIGSGNGGVVLTWLNSLRKSDRKGTGNTL
ncbi:MAG: glycosyltransferase family 2 protein [Gammaproteobacteria bacterium]|nr:glycosyltransferase family 2 protein [Gammaproteobacteria bacterium]